MECHPVFNIFPAFVVYILVGGSGYHHQPSSTKTAMSPPALVAFFLTILSVVAAAPQNDEGLVKKLQMVNIDQVLENDRLLKNSLKCILSDTDTGCTAEGKEIKSK